MNVLKETLFVLATVAVCLAAIGLSPPGWRLLVVAAAIPIVIAVVLSGVVRDTGSK